LAKIDEECAAFEAIGANHDVGLDEKISSTDPALSQIKVVVREEGSHTKTKAGDLACNTLFTVMVVCAIIVLAIPPILTYTFADPTSAKIVLPKAVPSLAVIGTILGLYTFATGVAFFIAVASVGIIRRRRGLLSRRRREVLLLASVASLVGLLHVGWVALWFLPVCRHA